MTACSRQDTSRWEKKVSAASIPAGQPDAGVPAAIVLPPATVQDVRETIARIYGDTVQLGDSPRYVIGDFNGDSSDDLAVEVRAVSNKLGALNDVAANWILEDPKQIFVPDPTQKVQHLPPAPPRPHLRADESLLVIVHGFGPQGWREPTARQSYLLHNAGGSRLALAKKDDVLNRLSGPSPRLSGDLIRTEQSGREELLFWTGGHYAWFRNR